MTDYSNPFRGILPKVVHKDDQEQAAQTELLLKREGEVPLDAYVKALMDTPEVAARIVELENCLQRLASEVRASGRIDKAPRLRAATEEAAEVLKNRLEVADVVSRVQQRMSAREAPFQEHLRLTPSHPKKNDSES